MTPHPPAVSPRSSLQQGASDGRRPFVSATRSGVKSARRRVAALCLGLSTLLAGAMTPAHALLIDIDFSFGTDGQAVSGTIFGLARTGIGAADRVEVLGQGFLAQTGPLVFPGVLALRNVFTTTDGNLVAADFDAYAPPALPIDPIRLAIADFCGALCILVEGEDFNGGGYQTSFAFGDEISLTVVTRAVPEPATLGLLGAGLFAFRAARRRVPAAPARGSA